MFCSMKWGIGNSNEMGNGSDLGPSANINKHQTHIGFNHETVQILCWYKFSIMLTQPLCKKQRQEGSRQFLRWYQRWCFHKIHITLHVKVPCFLLFCWDNKKTLFIINIFSIVFHLCPGKWKFSSLFSSSLNHLLKWNLFKRPCSYKGVIIVPCSSFWFTCCFFPHISQVSSYDTLLL